MLYYRGEIINHQPFILFLKDLNFWNHLVVANIIQVLGGFIISSAHV